jgi:hypothetical protein
VSISSLRNRLNVPPPAEPAAPSLPPVPGETLAPAPTTPPKRDYVKIEKNSMVRRKAVAIVAMRAQGYSNDEIAAELKIKPQSIKQYLYRATKSGFLVNKDGLLLQDPHDALEFDVAHRAVRNLKAALDDEPIVTKGGEIKAVSPSMTKLALKVAEGTLFKKFDQSKDPQQHGMQVLAVRVEMPAGAAATVDAASIGGAPAYSDAEFDGGS